MKPETLASFVILGRVDNRPTDMCAAWIDSADRICGKPAPEPSSPANPANPRR